MGKLKRKKKTVFRRYRRHRPRTGSQPVFELQYTEDGKFWSFCRKWLDDIQGKFDTSDYRVPSDMWPEVFDYPTSKEEIELIDDPFLRNALLKVQSEKEKNPDAVLIILELLELKKRLDRLPPTGRKVTRSTEEIRDNDIASLYGYQFQTPEIINPRDIQYELQEVSKRELGLCSQGCLVMEPELFEPKEGDPFNYLNCKKNIPITEDDRERLESNLLNLMEKIDETPVGGLFMRFVRLRAIKSLIENPQQDTLSRTSFTFEAVKIDNENIEPIDPGWYLCNAVDDRWDGELRYRAWGHGQWWTPFSDGWISSRMGIYQWVGPVADVNGPAPDGTNPTKQEKLINETDNNNSE